MPNRDPLHTMWFDGIIICVNIDPVDHVDLFVAVALFMGNPYLQVWMLLSTAQWTPRSRKNTQQQNNNIILFYYKNKIIGLLIW